jgi:hypothetical protein
VSEPKKPDIPRNRARKGKKIRARPVIAQPAITAARARVLFSELI